MNYETKLLNAIVADGDFALCGTENVKNVFVEQKDVWSFITDHYDSHKKVPSSETIKHHFPDFEVFHVTEPLQYYIDVALDECIRSGLNVGVFEVDRYYCWGTPKSLLEYK